MNSFLTMFNIVEIFMESRLPSFEVVVGVVTNRVSGFKHLRKDIRVLVDILAHHEERRFDIVLGQNIQQSRRHFRYRTVIKGEIDRLSRTEHAVRIETLPYVAKFYHARLEAPKMAASLSLSTEMETGILPFQIGMRLASNASRIGSMIQCPDLVRPPKRMIASGLEKWT